MGEARRRARVTTVALVVASLVVTVATSNELEDTTEAVATIPQTEVDAAGNSIAVTVESDVDRGRTGRAISVQLTGDGTAMVVELLAPKGEVLAVAPLIPDRGDAFLEFEEPCVGPACLEPLEVRVRPLDRDRYGTFHGEVEVEFSSASEDPPAVDLLIGEATPHTDGAAVTGLGPQVALSFGREAPVGQRVTVPRSACADDLWFMHWGGTGLAGLVPLRVVTSDGEVPAWPGRALKLPDVCDQDPAGFWVVGGISTDEPIEPTWSLVGGPGVADATVFDALASNSETEQVEVTGEPVSLQPVLLPPAGGASVFLATAFDATTGEAADVRIGGSSGVESEGPLTLVAGPCPEVACPGELELDVRRVGSFAPGEVRTVFVRLYHLEVPE